MGRSVSARADWRSGGASDERTSNADSVNNAVIDRRRWRAVFAVSTNIPSLRWFPLGRAASRPFPDGCPSLGPRRQAFGVPSRTSEGADNTDCTHGLSEGAWAGRLGCGHTPGMRLQSLIWTYVRS